MRYFVKFGYLGTKFTGFQRGNGKRSVEDTIVNVLERMKAASGISSAGRTDRNVSAMGNVFALETEVNIRSVLSKLNSAIEHMAFHSYAQVEDGRMPRHNESKVYRYISTGYSSGDLEKVLRPFEGKHDFTNFARLDQRNPLRSIEKIEVSDHGRYVSVDFHGRSFIWHQIRRIMGFAFTVISGGLDVDPFSDHGITDMAPAENLILLDITYSGIEFRMFSPPSMIKRARADSNSAFLQSVYQDGLLSMLEGSIYAPDEY